MGNKTGPPVVDNGVVYIRTSQLRELSVEKLEKLRSVTVIQGTQGKRLAVLVPFDAYMKLQRDAGIGR